jgi:hypothetical protein
LLKAACSKTHGAYEKLMSFADYAEHVRRASRYDEVDPRAQDDVATSPIALAAISFASRRS